MLKQFYVVPESFVDGNMPDFKNVMREVSVPFCPKCGEEMKYEGPFTPRNPPAYVCPKCEHECVLKV